MIKKDYKIIKRIINIKPPSTFSKCRSRTKDNSTSLKTLSKDKDTRRSKERSVHLREPNKEKDHRVWTPLNATNLLNKQPSRLNWMSIEGVLLK